MGEESLVLFIGVTPTLLKKIIIGIRKQREERKCCYREILSA